MLYPNRPKIKLRPTTADKFAEALGWCALLAGWIWVTVVYSALPDIVPVHFDLSGQVDGYASKSSLWGLLAVGSAIYIGMTWMNRFPHLFNYATAITPENALHQYTLHTRILRYLKLFIPLIFDYLAFKIISIATEGLP